MSLNTGSDSLKLTINILDANYECDTCDSYCSECSLERNYCSKCVNEVTINKNSTQVHLKIEKINNFCVTEDDKNCGSGYYMDQTENSCRYCDVTCLECNGPTSKNCLKCPDKRPYLQDQQCVAVCSDGYYLNETASRCFPYVLTKNKKKIFYSFKFSH